MPQLNSQAAESFLTQIYGHTDNVRFLGFTHIDQFCTKSFINMRARLVIWDYTIESCVTNYIGKSPSSLSRVSSHVEEDLFLVY